MKKTALTALALLAALCCLLTGCGKDEAPDIPAALPEANTVNAGVDVLQFRRPAADALVADFVTDKGEFAAVLYPDAAPQAVQNFVTLAREGAYNGLPFHRIVEDFVIQTGDTDGEGGTSIWSTPFPAETSSLLRHYTGALAMAGGEANRSQFYVVNCTPDSVPDVLAQQMLQLGWDEKVITAYTAVGGAPYLDDSYTVFGQVIWGMDAVRSIGQEHSAEAAPVLTEVSVTDFAAWQAAHPDAGLSFYGDSDASGEA